MMMDRMKFSVLCLLAASASAFVPTPPHHSRHLLLSRARKGSFTSNHNHNHNHNHGGGKIPQLLQPSPFISRRGRSSGLLCMSGSPPKLSVGEMRKELDTMGVYHQDCFEKRLKTNSNDNNDNNNSNNNNNTATNTTFESKSRALVGLGVR
jgi:hypothetical protein